MTPDEVRLLDNKLAILFVRGEKAVMDFKYDILKHPNIAFTADGKAKPYEHGQERISVATIKFLPLDEGEIDTTDLSDSNYELLSEEYFDTHKI